MRETKKIIDKIRIFETEYYNADFRLIQLEDKLNLIKAQIYKQIFDDVLNLKLKYTNEKQREQELTIRLNENKEYQQLIEDKLNLIKKKYLAKIEIDYYKNLLECES